MIVLAIESSCDETGVGIAELSADGTVTLLADEVASSVAWLCHPEQAMVTGHALVLSGGEVF